MKKLALLAISAAAAAVSGCAYDTYGPNDGGWGYYDRGYYTQYGSYDYDRPDPRYNGYYADRYYREDPRYRERQLSYDDRVYVGNDGRYYCRRSDGTTGLIVGGIAGGALGSIIAPGGAKPLGAVLGAIAGGAVGTSADRNRVTCR
ncbi:hypothetical protein HMF7854_03035 [Sphingomonas ginkgonis]|uniref:17 kDa surface antigen n=1 Tax=Sphingomonas ginkgonis TaxID=2315330 RepID=A0A429V7F7_9SPHN|nr:hypothetical protein [Sphingomonas ginkgonis]RST29911.1 hypothetical protein HMF7854_03035 [Sphingomonas ginkgonis]